MVAISGFNIDLNNSAYKPGDIVKGWVNFKINQTAEINCVKIVFTGSSKVHWTAEISVKNDLQNTPNTSTQPNKSSLNQEPESSAPAGAASKPEWEKKTIVNYVSSEEWFNSTLVLMNNLTGDKLETGIHSYSFQFILPNNIPASFKHSAGSIIYAAEASIEMPRLTSEKILVPFKVSDSYDLNKDRTLMIAYGNTAKKEFCCDILNCRNEPVLANFSVEKSGYIPGQSIKFNVIIDNKSSRAIVTKTVTLYKHMKFHASGQTKTDKLEIASVCLQTQVEPRSKEKWHNQILNIPGDCKASSQYSKIIEVKYELVLYFAAAGFTTGTDCSIPIVVGTEPFTGETSEVFSEFCNISDCPPSYEEAMLVSASAPPQPETSWINSLIFWK